ncbi:MAG TPA: hypothetical protein VG675_16090 [Bryobacteraceae bacterium]|nr:hypothetical protein [Bryobacteraceae bacterium]
MKARAVLGAMALAFLLAGTSAAADVSGKWVANILTRMGGSQMTTFTFQADGTKLTGTMSARQGGREITEGKIQGDKISFVTVEKSRDTELKTLYKGKVAGDEIQFSYQLEMPPRGFGGFIPPPPMEFTAKRTK